MKTFKLNTTLLITLFTALFLFTAIGSSKLVDDKQNVETETQSSTFTLSGTTAGGHPLLSWNSVEGAAFYELYRLPTSSYGVGTEEKFIFYGSDSLLDSDVVGAVLGTGIEQVRYQIFAYDQYDNLLDSAGPVDYIADSIN